MFVILEDLILFAKGSYDHYLKKKKNAMLKCPTTLDVWHTNLFELKLEFLLIKKNFFPRKVTLTCA